MSPENARFLLVVLVGPVATCALYILGVALNSRALTLPGRAVWGLYRAFAAVCGVLAPIAYIPLLLLAIGAVAVVPGLWIVVLAVGLGQWILRS